MKHCRKLLGIFFNLEINRSNPVNHCLALVFQCETHSPLPRLASCQNSKVHSAAVGHKDCSYNQVRRYTYLNSFIKAQRLKTRRIAMRKITTIRGLLIIILAAQIASAQIGATKEAKSEKREGK